MVVGAPLGAMIQEDGNIDGTREGEGLQTSRP